jgi:hypothetical protein
MKESCVASDALASDERCYRVAEAQGPDPIEVRLLSMMGRRGWRDAAWPLEPERRA